MIEEEGMVIKRKRIEGVKEKEGDLGGGGVLWRRKRTKRDPRGKGKGEDDQEGIGIIKRRKGMLDQRGHWKKKEVFGRGRRVFLRIKIIKASWTRVLFD